MERPAPGARRCLSGSLLWDLRSLRQPGWIEHLGDWLADTVTSGWNYVPEESLDVAQTAVDLAESVTSQAIDSGQDATEAVAHGTLSALYVLGVGAAQGLGALGRATYSVLCDVEYASDAAGGAAGFGAALELARHIVSNVKNAAASSVFGAFVSVGINEACERFPIAEYQD